MAGGDGADTYIFGKGGAERTAQEMGVPFLGALPLYTDIGATSDSGQPIAATAPDSPAGKFFEALALKDGRVCAGLVLALVHKDGRPHTRVFLAGLLDWCGPAAPTASDLRGARVLVTGAAHVKTIEAVGGAMLGCIELPGPAPLDVDLQAHVLAGGSVWGYAFIREKAAALYASGGR